MSYANQHSPFIYFYGFHSHFQIDILSSFLATSKRSKFTTYICFPEFVLMCVFACNSFRIAAKTTSNMSRHFRSTAPYIKLYKTLQIHSVHLSIRNVAHVLLLMFIFRTVRNLTLENETTCGTVRFPRYYFCCLHN